MSNNTLRVLLVEDSEDDALLMLRLLKQGGHALAPRRVETAPQLRAALAEQPWDIVLCDYRLPQLDGLAALQIVREMAADLPVIIVSGAIGEDLAVDALKAGANDYVLKDRLGRLLPAIGRELREAEVRRQRRQAEEALRESEERLRVAMQAARQGAWEIDLATEEVAADQRVADIFGVDDAHPLRTRTDWRRFVLPEDDGLIQAALAAAAKGDGRYEVEFRVCRPDGAVRWVRSEGRLYRGGGRGPDRLLGVIRDITERKAAAEALRQGREDFDRAQAVGQIGWWRLDTRKNVLTWSPENHRIFGVPEGTPMSYEFFLSTIHPDDRQYVDTQWSAGLRGAPYDIEHRIVVAGKIKWVREKAYLEFDPAGQLLGGFGITQDITARKEAEAQLRLHNAALETAANAIAITDRQGIIQWVNPAFTRLTGYGSTEAIGQNSRLLKSGQHEPGFYARMWETILAGHVWQGELVNRRADGSVYTEEMTITPVRATGNDISHFIAVKQDITARKQAEADLRASRARAQLLADINSRLLAADDPQALVAELCRDVMRHLDCQCFFNYIVTEAFPDRLHLNACAGIPAAEAAKIEWLDFGTAVCGCVARDNCRILAEDIAHRDDPRTQLVRNYGIQAYACHPLRAGGRLIGTLSFGTKTRPTFSDDELELMRVVTDQVAIAMQRMQVQQALADSEERFRLATEAMRGLVYEWEPATNTVRRSAGLFALTGYRIEEAPAAYEWWLRRIHPVDLGRCKAQYEQAFRERRSVVSTEYRVRHKNDRYVWVWDNARLTYDPTGKLARWIGCTVSIDERKQAEEDLRQLNAELETRVAARTRELAAANESLRAEIRERRRLEEAIQTVSENEKERLGQDLHDGLGQYLVALNLHAATVEHRLQSRRAPEAADLAKMSERISAAIDLTRRLCRGLYPAALDRDGLAPALGQLAEHLADLFAVPVKFRERGRVVIKDSAIARHLYRIAQEAATNACKHAQAKQIVISLSQARGAVCLRVLDNGTGLLPSRKADTGLGSSIMKYRAQTIGAALNIQSTPGHGTRVECQWHPPTPPKSRPPRTRAASSTPAS